MSTETHEDKPAYAMQADGTLALNGAGIALETRYQQARIGLQALQASWTGAFLARIFMKHAWLDAVTLSFAISMEYDDSGGFYRQRRFALRHGSVTIHKVGHRQSELETARGSSPWFTSARGEPILQGQWLKG